MPTKPSIVYDLWVYLPWNKLNAHLAWCANNVVAAFNQEKAPVGSFSVITNLHLDLRVDLLALALTVSQSRVRGQGVQGWPQARPSVAQHSWRVHTTPPSWAEQLGVAAGSTRR